MAVMKILYLVVLAALVVFYVLYIDTFALIMLLCALLLPIILLYTMLHLRLASAAALTCDTDTAAAGESIPVTITVRNRSFLSFPQALAVVDVHHSFGTGRERLRLRFPLQAHNVTKMTFYVQAQFCGSVDVSLKKLYVPDYFRIFRTKITVRQKTANVLILPKRLQLPIQNSSEPVYFPDSDTFGDRPGDDASEIFGFHEYIPGEQVSRIHWKLSSKSEQLFVKEFSDPIQKSVLLLLSYKRTTHAGIQEAEMLLTIFYSIVCQMFEQQVIPVILWYDAQNQRMERHEPTNPGQLKDVFRLLYGSISSMELDPQSLLDTASLLRFSSVTCITNSLPQPLLQAIDKRLTANIKSILYVTDSDAMPSDTSEETEILHVSPKAGAEALHQLLI